MRIRLAALLQPDSIVDGEGIRTVIWTQGCVHNCYGCQNPTTHSFTGGGLLDVEEIKEQLASLQYQDGITFSGGDPMCQPAPCAEIARYAKSIGMSVWCYTGYTFEELMALPNPDILTFLRSIDVLIDGKFEMEKRSFDCTFRGSTNQRVIDVARSLESGSAVLITKYDCSSVEPTYQKSDYIFV